MAVVAGQLGNMAHVHQRAEDLPYGTLVEEDLFDDSTGAVPIKGLSTPLSLEHRFVRRLSKLLGAGVTAEEDLNHQSIDIYLERSGHTNRPSIMLDEALRKFILELEQALKSIARSPDGVLHSTHCFLY